VRQPKSLCGFAGEGARAARALLLRFAVAVPAQDDDSGSGPKKCDGSHFPMKLQGAPAAPVSCCLGCDHVMVHVGRTKEMIAFRLLGKACTMYGHSTPCSGSQCQFGPCGAAIPGFTTDTVLSSPADAHVFHPQHAVKSCGFQAEIGPNLFSFYPEPYKDQLEYPRVTPSCPYASCVS
jgi:hypothetical protein